tara:strand:+ start:93 stop:383 length:291 start_codon:yes stop_codon:yes gene_type:complete
MLLKETIEGNKRVAHYNSSNVLKSVYETNTNRLSLYFKSGFIYEYSSVGNSDYMKFATAESQGKVFHKVIKNKPNKRTGNFQLKEVISEIKDILYG